MRKFSLKSFVLLALFACCQSQVEAANFPLGLAFQPNDANGKNYPGALLYHYNAGTAVLKNTYSDHNLVTAQAQPIVANSHGRFAPIYLLNNSAYKFVLKNAAGVTLWTMDNVYGNQSEYGTIVAGVSTDGTTAVTGTNTGAGIGTAGDTSGGTGFALSGTGNATRAPLYLAPQTAPATTTKGSVWVDSVTGSLSVYDGTLEHRTVNQLHAYPGAAAAESDTIGTGATAFSTSAATIAANTLRVGQTIRGKAWIDITAVADGAGTFDLYIRLAAGNVVTIPFDYVACTTSENWNLDFVITITSIGAGGTYDIVTRLGYSLGAAAYTTLPVGTYGSSGAAINTTAANTIDFSSGNAAAGFAVTGALRMFIVDISS